MFELFGSFFYLFDSTLKYLENKIRSELKDLEPFLLSFNFLFKKFIILNEISLFFIILIGENLQ